MGEAVRDLSVLIPARNEMFLKRTVEDVLAHKEADTEVIVVCDGAWPMEPLDQHKDVTVIHLAQSIGQRAATNLAARLSSARYVMKLDAHCAVDQGFDRKLIQAAQELGEDVTQIPAQWNLHAFDWLCTCGKRLDQGPTPVPCACGGSWSRDMVWANRRQTLAWRFDATLKFGYFGEWKDRTKDQEIADTMSCLGACWFLSRERYWQLGGLDEQHGSWGQMGTELACKSWLSGGRMVTNKRTWFSHMFRTQGSDFGFPYPIKQDDQEAARAYSRQLWMHNAWPGQVRPLKWLVEKFAPVPGWWPEQIAALPELKKPTKGLAYYSDCRGDETVLASVRKQIVGACNGYKVVSATLAPVEMGQNIVLPLERGYLTMFKQILAGLEALDTDIAFLVEHDVLYHPSHFDFVPPRDDMFYYNQHVYKVSSDTGQALHYRCSQTSGLCANRQLLVAHYQARVAKVEAEGFSRRIGFEPGTRSTRRGGVDDSRADVWMSPSPNVDIRHGHNLTPSRWKKEQFRDQRYTVGWTEADAVPGWGVTKGRFAEFLAEATCAR